MRKTYFAPAYKILGWTPAPSSIAIQAVEQTESRLGIRFPEAVREWYSCDHAIDTLYKNSNSDPPIPVTKFQTIWTEAGLLLPFRLENQGVCTWAILLDGSEDPSVLVDVDSDGREWHMLAPNFSTYIYTCIWDYQVVLHTPLLVQGQNAPLSAAAVKKLERFLRPEPQTYGWPGSTQHRFAGEQYGVLIWSAESQADWFIGAQDQASMEAALRSVWNIDDCGRGLCACGESARRVLLEVAGRS